jgi:hypothetical protein
MMSNSLNNATTGQHERVTVFNWLVNMTTIPNPDATATQITTMVVKRKPVGIMGIAAGVFLGNLITAVAASVVYFLITH